MNIIEKRIIKNFLGFVVPAEFLNTSDKLLFNEFFKGKCSTFFKTSTIDNESLSKIVALKNDLLNEIDFQDTENVIYFLTTRTRLRKRRSL